jgi:Ser/Thr protein kinase RdoA (MazF antagonist)
MHHFRIEQFVDGRWLTVKDNLSATLAAFGVVLSSLKQPGAPWRAVRSDGEVFNP